MIEFINLNEKVLILRDGQIKELHEVPEALHAINRFLLRHPDVSDALKQTGLTGTDKYELFIRCFLGGISQEADVSSCGSLDVDNPCQCDTCPLAKLKNRFHYNSGYLTPREKEVMVRIANGKFVKEIAHEMEVCEQTVNYHKSEIFGKLGFSSSLEIATYAAKHNLV